MRGAWLACTRDSSLSLELSSASQTSTANGLDFSPIEAPQQLPEPIGPHRPDVLQKKRQEVSAEAHGLLISARSAGKETRWLRRSSSVVAVSLHRPPGRWSRSKRRGINFCLPPPSLLCSPWSLRAQQKRRSEWILHTRPKQQWVIYLHTFPPWSYKIPQPAWIFLSTPIARQ